MEMVYVISIVIVSVLVTAVIVYLVLRHQKDAVLDEVQRLTLLLMEMEQKMETDRPAETSDTGGDDAADENLKVKDLSAMDDKELFEHLSRVIRDEELFRRPDFNRSAVMEHFSLSAARVGGAFVRGGGMGLPEFVRNCRLDYACRLMVERPELTFTEVGGVAGFSRTTIFYHDFKARYGMPPAEYRAQQLNAQ